MRRLLRVCLIFLPYGLFSVGALASSTELQGSATQSDSKSQTTLVVSWLNDNVNERYLIADIEREFAKVAPHITLESIGVHTDSYKQKVERWLRQEEGPDVLYWYGNTPLKTLASKGYVSELEDLWIAENLENAFEPSIVSQVRLDGSVYAVPVSFYPWAFYYNQSLFSRLDLSPPATWEAFLHVCETLKKNDIVPIAIGYNAPWVLTSWFEFINLRLNGESFHLALLNGDVPYTHPKVKQVFTYWKVLIDKGYFLEAGESMNWQEPLPFLYRELAGMALLGHFLSARIPLGIKSEIKVFPFPTMPFQSERVELAPVDVFFIRASSPNQQAAKAFLAFMASYEAQGIFSKYAGGFSPLVNASPLPGYFNEAGINILRTADSTAPYFDRTVKKEFGNAAMALFQEFMVKPDVEVLSTKLEALRLQLLEPETQS